MRSSSPQCSGSLSIFIFLRFIYLLWWGVIVKFVERFPWAWRFDKDVTRVSVLLHHIYIDV
jgi:hypothetical protein